MVVASLFEPTLRAGKPTFACERAVEWPGVEIGGLVLVVGLRVGVVTTAAIRLAYLGRTIPSAIELYRESADQAVALAFGCRRLPLDSLDVSRV